MPQPALHHGICRLNASHASFSPAGAALLLPSVCILRQSDLRLAVYAFILSSFLLPPYSPNTSSSFQYITAHSRGCHIEICRQAVRMWRGGRGAMPRRNRQAAMAETYRMGVGGGVLVVWYSARRQHSAQFASARRITGTMVWCDHPGAN